MKNFLVKARNYHSRTVSGSENARITSEIEYFPELMAANYSGILLIRLVKTLVLFSTTYF